MITSKDIAKKYHIDQSSFEVFIMNSGDYFYSDNILGFVLRPDDVENAVLDFLAVHDKERFTELKQEIMKSDAERQAEEEERRIEEFVKQEALSNMLITSGFTFDGYKITKYSGYISGDDAIQIERGLGGWLSTATNVGESLTKSLSIIRRNALKELKEAAYDLGCNAVIGVDFDYITLEPETANTSGGTTYLPYVFCVTANGNAVIIEKIET